MVERADSWLVVDMTVDLSSLKVASDRSIQYLPTVRRGDSLAVLPPLIVNGRARHILYERMDRDRMEEELGDLLFALVNMARLYGIDPENALERSNKKFIRRFEHIEKRADEQGVELTKMPLEEMEAYWQEAKREER